MIKNKICMSWGKKKPPSPSIATHMINHSHIPPWDMCSSIIHNIKVKSYKTWGEIQTKSRHSRVKTQTKSSSMVQNSNSLREETVEHSGVSAFHGPDTLAWCNSSKRLWSQCEASLRINSALVLNSTSERNSSDPLSFPKIPSTCLFFCLTSRSSQNMLRFSYSGWSQPRLYRKSWGCLWGVKLV